ncbi:MAG TPA: MFS transporter [Nocardioides sp.]|uniref:MFS transporter n=1 Tax=Nocardioides sp. TaxID=35761 RepID=UPI002E308309|nr:MFS transporter [Nocardioides sp.]HEX5090336.1 MFS transporter [Nocardioides sp.]
MQSTPAAAPAATPMARDQLARRAAALAFATQGMVFISLTTRLPRFSDKWDLSEVELSLLLLMIVLLAGAGSVVAELVAHRVDSARTLRAGLLTIGIAVPVLAAAPEVAVFVAALAAYGVGLGMVDATSNMQAVAVEHRYGRPILPSFHGAWTFGGIIGASYALAAAHAPLWTAGLVAVVPLAALFAPYLPREHGEALAEAAQVAVPWRPILLVGLGMVLFYMVDTAAQTWGPTFLDDVVGAPQGLVALATLPYLVASLAMRLAGDSLVLRYGATPVLRTGAVVASLALLVVVTSPTWPVAVVGFTLLGAGVSVIAPLSFSAAARIAGGEQARVDAVIARFNQFNYVGGLLGAVLTGLVGAGSLRLGFAVPMVLILGILPLAPAFAPAGTVTAPAPQPIDPTV